jgi:hypothetical protein
MTALDLSDTGAMTLRYSSAPPTAAAFKALYDTTGWSPAGRPARFYADT